MRLGEFGIEFIFAAGQQLVDATYLALVFTAPDGTELVKELPTVVVGAVDVYSTAGYLQQGTYASCTLVNGDITQSGTWSVQLIYQDAYPRKLISAPVTFEVEV